MRRRQTRAASRGKVALKLVPQGHDTFGVVASNRGARYPYENNPIGVVKQNADGTWSHSAGHNPRPIYGNFKTAERAAMEMYRSHRSWVGY